MESRLFHGKISNPMTISIITPSYGQLDWLKLCVASVADQVGAGCESRKVKGAVTDANIECQEARCSLRSSPKDEAVRRRRGNQRPGQQKVGSSESNHLRTIEPSDLPTNRLAIEHIIQDGGTPGIEEFTSQVGEELKSRYGGDFVSDLQTFELLHFHTASGYTLRVFKEPDAGMYDALNKGISRMSGDLWAWLNSDEQYLPGTLAYVAAWFSEHPKVDILCGDALLTDEMGNALSYRRVVRPGWRHTRSIHLSSLSCASFYRRSIVEKVGGFDTTWRSIGDAEWMARMFKANIRIQACSRLLSTFAFTGQNTSESPAAKKEAQQWKKMPGAPSKWLQIPVILHHRFRKWLAGSYVTRSVAYHIYGKESGKRLFRSINSVGWGWPSAEKNKVARLDPKTVAPASKTIRVLGTDLLATTYLGLSELLVNEARQAKRPFVINFANTQIVTMRKHDADFALLTESVDITVPDGMPLVWAMNAKNAGLEDRVYGPTFTREFMASCPGELTHYLVGGSEECGSRFRERMLKRNPLLNFVGGYHGECSVEGLLKDDESVLRELREKKPDFIWVGLGTPKQYGWIHRIKPLLEHGVMLAVGFALDVNAGMKPDAPLWMQGIGMTWLYRMATEPERLAGRYLKWNTLFLRYWALECLAPRLRKFKLWLRKLLLSVFDVFASDIKDCVTGESLGRVFVFGWGGRPWVIGHEGLPPLIPRFLPQRRLTYWKQSIGFTTHQRPDFPRLAGVAKSQSEKMRVMNVVLAHTGQSQIWSLIKIWEEVCPPEDLWIAFGGSRADFESIDYSRKVFIEDPNLRKLDNQREKQSYTGIFQAMSPAVEKANPDFVYFCEYDHLPLVHDLNSRQVDEMLREDADVMGHWLYRVDGTGHYHELYHESDPSYLPFWRSVSRREEKSLMLTMFGSGSFWTRDAFLAVAKLQQTIECYLEIYLPTLAHHLGFRVRPWRDEDHLISNLPSLDISLKNARKKACWTVHPVKELKAHAAKTNERG